MKEKNELKKQVADRLKIARDLAGLSQIKAAKFLEKSRPTISEIEAGRRNVTSSEILQFSDLYDVESSWLLGEEDESDNYVKSKIKLAARELSKMSKDDVEKLFRLLSAMKRKRKS